MKFSLLALPILISSTLSSAISFGHNNGASLTSLESLISKRLVGHRQRHRPRKLDIIRRAEEDEDAPTSTNTTTSGDSTVGKIEVFQNGDSLGFISQAFTTGSSVVSLAEKLSTALTVRFVPEANELRIWNALEAILYPTLGFASLGDDTVGKDVGSGSAQIAAMTFTKRSDKPSKVGNFATQKETTSTSNGWSYNSETNALTASWDGDKVSFFILQEHIFLSGDVKATEKYYDQNVSSDLLSFKLVPI